MSERCVILSTFPSRDVAFRIVTTLLEARYIACANIVPQIESLYWWEEKIQQDNEVLVIMKSRVEMFPLIEEVVMKHHPYAVPELVMLPIERGHEPYMKWIGTSTGESGHA